MDTDKDFILKVIIVGEAAVGKTSLVIRFVSNRFKKDYRSTIGTNIYSKEIELPRMENISLNLWDIAGQERWTRMRHRYYRGSHGAIIVGDLTRPNTFEQIKEFWIPDLRKFLSNVPILLIGNKNDLENRVSLNKVKEMEEEINAVSGILTSAKTGENVEDAFKILTKEILNDFH